MPAVSLGDWIRENNLPAEVGYLCGSRELERKIYKALHVDHAILPLSGSPFGVKGCALFCVGKNLSFLW